MTGDHTYTSWHNCVALTRCPFHKYTASACGLASFPRKRESRRRAPWGLDARLRGHDVLLAPDLRNRHLVQKQGPCLLISSCPLSLRERVRVRVPNALRTGSRALTPRPLPRGEGAKDPTTWPNRLFETALGLLITPVVLLSHGCPQAWGWGCTRFGLPSLGDKCGKFFRVSILRERSGGAPHMCGATLATLARRLCCPL